MRWTREEIDLLYSDMNNEEIAEKVGRSVAAVRRLRYYHTGRSCASDLPVGREFISKAEGEARIIRMAKQMGIKIEGIR